METIPSLDELIGYYAAKGLIAYEGIIREMSQKIREIPIEIPLEEIERNVALLGIWPLIEKYKIHQNSIGNDLKRHDKEKLDELNQKFLAISSSTDLDGILSNGKNQDLDISFLNPYDIQRGVFWNTVFSVMCDPLETHIQRTTLSRSKTIHDAQMGGTVYLVGKDHRIPFIGGSNYSFLQRSFMTVNKEGEPLLFMDNIEGGEPFFKTLDHWRGFDEDGKEQVNPNKIGQVYLAVAALMYMAERLDISQIVPRDFELVELSKNLGLRERRIFSKSQDYWKIGLHSKTKYKGVYVHSLYRGTHKNRQGHQENHRVLNIFAYRNAGDMYTRLGELGEIIINSNAERRRILHGTQQRMLTLEALNDIIQHYYFTPERLRIDAADYVAYVKRTINHRFYRKINY